MVLSSRRPIAPFRWKKRPHKSKCSYACLPIRWHGSPCGPAVREVVHQFSVEGLRVRGPIALASAREQHQRLAQPRCLPLHARRKKPVAPFVPVGAESTQQAVPNSAPATAPYRRFESELFSRLTDTAPKEKKRSKRKGPL